MGSETSGLVEEETKYHLKLPDCFWGPLHEGYKYDSEFTDVLIICASFRSSHCHAPLSIGELFLDDGRLNASLGDAKRKRQMTVFN
jgi:hypothetical protein